LAICMVIRPILRGQAKWTDGRAEPVRGLDDFDLIRR
jgi:hypothetical protein